MKTLAHSLLLVVSASLLLSGPTRAEGTALEKSNAFYLQGLAAEKAGDPVAAQAAYEAALNAYARNANARYRLGVVKSNFNQLAAKGTKTRLDKVVIPEFKVEGASFRESLTALQVLVEKESKSEVLPNFIIQDASGQLAEAKVSLQVKNVPAGSILEYLNAQVNAKARFDEHAIVLTPR